MTSNIFQDKPIALSSPVKMLTKNYTIFLIKVIINSLVNKLKNQRWNYYI